MSLTLVTHRVSEACRLARQLERRGEYRLAAEQLRFFWQGVGTRPDTEGLSTGEAAELLLRAGKLTGWLGSLGQVEGAQSIARDLLCEAKRLLTSRAQISECSNALAVTYWREGDYTAAKVTALSAYRERERDTEESAALINTLGMLEIEQGRLHAAREFLKENYREVLDSKSPHERCAFHNQFGLVNKRLAEASVEDEERREYFDAALIEYEGALALYIELGNLHKQAIVKNNIALVLALKGVPKLAHPYVQSAIEYAKSVKDNSLLGSLEETRAQVLLAENNLRGALVAIKASLGYLRGGEQYALRAESETTHGVILMRMGDKECADSAFEHAIQLAETAQISTVKIKLSRLRELMELHKSEALRYEREWVQLALDESGGHPSHAAQLIGIKHQSLIVKIKRFGLDTARVPARPRRKRKQP